MGTILLTGGTGLIGSALRKKLEAAGQKVHVLSRSGDAQRGIFYWDPYKGEMDEAALEGVDRIVHLAGSSVAGGRWTKKRKELILKSRVVTAQYLFRMLEERQQSLKRFVSISGVGYYGPKHSQPVTESQVSGNGFLAEVCREWEFAANQFRYQGAEVCIARTGIVMAEDSDFMKKLVPLIRWYAGAVLGSGKQISSWIHIDDIVEVLFQMTTEKLPAGVYNAVSPGSIPHAELMHALARTLNRRIVLPHVPKFVLELMLGELSIEVLSDLPVQPKALLDAGFTFRYPDIDSCLKAIYPPR